MTGLLLAELPVVFMVIGGIGLFLIIAIIWATVQLVVVGSPDEMLVIAGKRQRDGSGYRTVIGGRTYVIPVFEKVARISLRNLQVELQVKAQSGGGKMLPVIVTGVANVKVSSNPSERGNAIERFLGQPLAELQRVARETLEGGLRAVIGKMTPEEIVEDRDKFVATVMAEVSDDFRKLGLLIDSVNIQNVHDEDQYLESIARKARAAVLSEARKAEAQRAAEAIQKEAEADAAARRAKAERDAEARLTEAQSHQKAEEARYTAETAIAEAQNQLRIRQAELAREAALKEAEQQEAAAKSEQARLAATTVANAIAERDIAKAKAEGDAATLAEEGRARARAIEQIGTAIKANPEALQVMLVEMIPDVVGELASTVRDVELGQVTVVDGGHGDAIAGATLGRARILSESLATLETILGVDLRTVSQRIASSVAGEDAVATDGKGTPQPPVAAKR
jgi:flotillin